MDVFWIALDVNGVGCLLHLKKREHSRLNERRVMPFLLTPSLESMQLKIDRVMRTFFSPMAVSLVLELFRKRWNYVVFPLMP